MALATPDLEDVFLTYYEPAASARAGDEP